MKYGVFLGPSLRHSSKPSATLRQRRRRTAARNSGVVATVSMKGAVEATVLDRLGDLG
jgi:hypothetical protein